MARYTIEQLHRAFLRGPLTTATQSRANQWAGIVAFPVSASTVVVSTTAVASASLIFITPRADDDTQVVQARWMEVKSINPGHAFVIGTANGNGTVRSSEIMWMIVKGA